MLPERIACQELGQLTDARLFRELAYVDGKWRAGSSGRTRDVFDPANGHLLALVAELDAGEAVDAIDAAQRAFAAWRARLPQERSRLLRAWHEAVVAARQDLATLMTLEQGKPISEALGEIDYAASFIEWYAEEAKRINVESVTGHLPAADLTVRREPAGVAALVTPWNFPSAMVTRKAAAALAAGCTVVLHPSMETPLSALALAELADRVGLPAGVFNVVPGQGAKVVGAFCRDPRVRVLSFTGSTEVGRLLATQCADTVKSLVLELGGHAPFIVFADGDLERAVDSAVSAKFATSGQDCLAANRFFVQREVYDAFAAAFARRVKALEVGSGFTPGVEIGPLINEKAVAKCEAHVADALALGAKLLAGGRRARQGPLFYEPTLLADVPPQAAILREETFGPVAALTAFDEEAEVVARANDTDYGLIAYLHSRDYGRISRITKALDFGMVAVNRTKVTGAPVPFGGTKQSGLGREGARHGLEAFTELKYLCLDAA
ncbi:MAG: NAD-dependent succinate-semialdehyde dehydrogenase [Pseudomonadota bacterium]